MALAEILINRSYGETRVARLENGQLVEFQIERNSERGVVGNIYKGVVNRVLPGMQAAFVDVGLTKTGFLYVSNVVDPNRSFQEKMLVTDSDETEGESSAESTSTTASSSDHDREKSQSAFVPQDIAKLLKAQQNLMTQVIKEPMGTKGARLTGYVSIPGRYIVYIPEGDQIGISRRIENNSERDRLKGILEKHRPKKGGLIIRTVAEGASEKNLKSDLDYLLKLWGHIKKLFDKQKKSGVLYKDIDLALKILRDRVTEDVSKIVVDDNELFKEMGRFAQSYLPRFKKSNIELYRGQTRLFDHYGIEATVKRALAKKVWLKSGGYIIIDETEALTSIDVNTGRFVGKRNLEDTILQTNLEAVKEVAYQIRLRNLGGIIILDFIDMEKTINRTLVYESLEEELKSDPVKTSILPISELGLIEMTRKRTRASLRDQLTSSCNYCEGKGYVRSLETMSFEILRECEKEARSNPAQSLAVYCHPEIADFFREGDGFLLDNLEKKLGCSVIIKTDANLHMEEYEIFSKDT